MALVVTTSGRIEAQLQDEWNSATEQAEAEIADTLAGKDAFIAEQADLLRQLVERDLIRWHLITDDELRNRLADYV